MLLSERNKIYRFTWGMYNALRAAQVMTDESLIQLFCQLLLKRWKINLTSESFFCVNIYIDILFYK